jgi:hypothetical protein
MLTQLPGGGEEEEEVVVVEVEEEEEEELSLRSCPRRSQRWYMR